MNGKTRRFLKKCGSDQLKKIFFPKITKNSAVGRNSANCLWFQLHNELESKFNWVQERHVRFKSRLLVWPEYILHNIRQTECHIFIDVAMLTKFFVSRKMSKHFLSSFFSRC